MSDSGARVRRVARIWWCGDDYCDCRQAEVVDITPATGRFVRQERVAVGTFFTDGEGWPTLEIQRDHLALLYGAEVTT